MIHHITHIYKNQLSQQKSAVSTINPHVPPPIPWINRQVGAEPEKILQAEGNADLYDCSEGSTTNQMKYGYIWLCMVMYGW